MGFWIARVDTALTSFIPASLLRARPARSVISHPWSGREKHDPPVQYENSDYLEQTGGSVLCFDRASHRDCINDEGGQREHVRGHLNRPRGRCRSLLETRGEKIGECAPIQCTNGQRIQGTQPHHLLEALERPLGQDTHRGDPAPAVPGRRAIRVQRNEKYFSVGAPRSSKLKSTLPSTSL
jgi:hypothetical protein